jgi:hypothetical protein
MVPRTRGVATTTILVIPDGRTTSTTPYRALPNPSVEVMRILSDQASTVASPSATTVTESSNIDSVLSNFVKWFFLGFGGAFTLAVVAAFVGVVVVSGILNDSIDRFTQIMADEYPEIYARLGKDLGEVKIVDENGNPVLPQEQEDAMMEAMHLRNFTFVLECITEE